MPAPLIEFAKFAEPAKWLLRRGRPPWLDDPRWYANAVRASLVLGILGTATGWLSVGGTYLANFIESQLGGQARWLSELVLGFICGPGLWFGLGVLVPLSRWLDRGWIMSLLAVPVSMLACFCGVMTLFTVKPIMGSTPDWIPGGGYASGFYAGFVGAAIVSLWMGHPFKRTAWRAGLLATTLAALGCGVIFLTEPEVNSAYVPQPVTQFIDLGLIYVTFQSLTALGLGSRLWWGGGLRANDHRE